MTLIYYLLCVAILLAAILIGYLSARIKRLQDAQLRLQQELQLNQINMELSEDLGRFGTWQLDAITRTVQWSDYIFHMHGRARSRGAPTLEEALGYYHVEDQPHVTAAVERALDEGEDFEFLARIVTDMGNELPVACRGTCQFDRNGKVLGVFGCFVDMSPLHVGPDKVTT